MHIQYKRLGKQYRKKSFLPMYHLETATANNFVLALSFCTCVHEEIYIYLHIFETKHIILCR